MPDQLTEFKRIVIDAKDVHRKIAAELWPNGVIASCAKCYSQKRLDLDQAADCLARGWPKCCGASMAIVGAVR